MIEAPHHERTISSAKTQNPSGEEETGKRAPKGSARTCGKGTQSCYMISPTIGARDIGKVEADMSLQIWNAFIMYSSKHGPMAPAGEGVWPWEVWRRFHGSQVSIHRYHSWRDKHALSNTNKNYLSDSNIKRRHGFDAWAILSQPPSCYSRSQALR